VVTKIFVNAPHFRNFVPSVLLLFALVINLSREAFAAKACAKAILFVRCGLFDAERDTPVALRLS
jgi:hypothetical protein